MGQAATVDDFSILTHYRDEPKVSQNHYLYIRVNVGKVLFTIPTDVPSQKQAPSRE